MDGKVVINTALQNKGLEKGIKNIAGSLGGLTKTLAKVAAAITVAFTTAAVAITKQAIDAYADYEQLTGGVETMFKASADKVKQYAEDAFYTVGISANEYMATVTSFSASLISSLGGDTDKAADVANTALIDMADNANKMGSSLESVQNAYQGFAKQQYQLLDNLKLGYGGTKTEMERLLKDATAFSGVQYDINNLSDVYEAIHQIQIKLDITGTTAKEAEKTITGSANMTKAAWSNVLAAIAGGGDLDKAINNLVYSISKYFDNIVPVVEKSLGGIGQLIEKIGPQLVQTVATALIKAIPSLLNAVYQAVIGLAKGIYAGIAALFAGSDATKEITAQINGVEDSANSAADATHDIADATEAAGKAAKKSLSGFDELNTLAEQSTEAELPDVSGDVSLMDVSVGTVTVGGDINDQLSPVFQNFIEKVKSFGEKAKTVLQPSISAWCDAFSGLGPAVEDSGHRISTAWINLRDNTLAPFGAYITTDFVPSITNTFSTTFAPIFTDTMPVAMDIWTTDFENRCLIVQEATGWLTTSFEGVRTVFSDMCESISTNWDTYGGDLLQGFKDFKDGLWETWWYIYDNIINPVITSCCETLSWLWEEHLKPLWDSIVEFVLSVSENILALWNGFIKPVVDYVVAYLAPIVTNVINGIWDAIYIVFAWISDVISGLLKYLDGFIQFVVGIFTLDWERAWGGIKKMFEGVWTSFEGTVKGVVNAIIWVINQLIAAIYSGIAGVVNGLGSIVKTVGNMLGKDWGFSIPTAAPKIPYLAQGAVLPPNKPFLAMVGDQKHGTNIEAPLSTIQEAVALVMTDQTQAILAGFEASVGVQREILEAVLGIQIGDDVIGNAVARYSRKQAVMRGGAL